MLIDEISKDGSLSYCRKLASMGMRGYSWDKGLLLHTIVDSVGSEVIRIVVPKSRRECLLELAHDKSGHVGSRKVADIIGKRFVWPNVSADIHNTVHPVVCVRSRVDVGKLKPYG